MKALIIEDEQHTAQRLQKLILDVDPQIEIVDILDSIEASVAWFKNNLQPDLIFQDIHLADGSCFEIYRETEVNSAVVFTTAYDQYAIDAFQVNSIDYLLKPVEIKSLEKAIDKFKKSHLKSTGEAISKLTELLGPKAYHKRFIVRYGDKIKTINTNDIAYFFTQEGNQFMRTFNNKTYPSDFSLDKLDDMLDPAIFFRINRQFIIHINALDEMYAYSKSRVKIELNPPCELETIASTERSGSFKKWLGGIID